MYAAARIVLIICLSVAALVNARTCGAQGEPQREPERLGETTRPVAFPKNGYGEDQDSQRDSRGLPSATHQMGFRLVGTVVADDSRRSLAVIENAAGEQRGYREGDFVGEILIKEILFGKLVIRTVSGEAVVSVNSEVGVLGSAPPPAGTTPAPAYLDKKEFDSALPNYTQLIREIRMRPRFSGGRPEGFVIYNITPESVLGRMGLRDGDVVVGVNGRSFSTTQPVVEFYDALKAGGTVSFKVKREEGIEDLHIEFTGAN